MSTALQNLSSEWEESDVVCQQPTSMEPDKPVEALEPIDFGALAKEFYSRKTLIKTMNPLLSKMPCDYLYHIGFSSNDPLQQMFGDVKFVIMGGSNTRMEKFARKVAKELNVSMPFGSDVVDLCNTDRYSIFKAGPLLAVSHGMGMPSVSILLHEITKVLCYASATNVVYIRMGTSGGLGLPPGSLVVSTKAVNGLLEPQYRNIILGQRTHRPGQFDPTISKLLASSWDEESPLVMGATMSTDDFYEGQGRLDGAICEYEENDKMLFLHEAWSRGVRNIEMESLNVAAFCEKLGIPAAMCAVTLLNRLRGDQIPADEATMAEYSDRPQRLVLNFMRRVMEHGHCQF